MLQTQSIEQNKVRVERISCIQDISRSDYDSLINVCGAPIFYQWEFLLAAEKHHLLPIDQTVYFVAYRDNKMVGFTQAYVLPEADPFGVLAETTGLDITAGKPALLSHIMHFYETCVVSDSEDNEAREVILDALKNHAQKTGIEYVGLMNVVDEQLMKQGRNMEWHVNFMWERYFIDFGPFNDIEAFLMSMNRFGRIEIRRQLRKFEASEAQCNVYREPIGHSKIEAVAELCFQTTKKNGTPQYYPPEIFAEFVKTCGPHVRLFTIEQGGDLLGALVCFEEQGALHLWAGGMRYDKSDFSPYSMLFYHTYLYVLKNNISTLEAGRTNKKIKERLGFEAKPLYSMITTVDV